MQYVGNSLELKIGSCCILTCNVLYVHWVAAVEMRVDIQETMKNSYYQK